MARSPWRKAEHGLPAIGVVPDLSGSAVPVPQAVAATVEREGKARLALNERLLGRTPLGDIEIKADDARRVAGLRIADDATEARKPAAAVAPLRLPDAVLDLVHRLILRAAAWTAGPWRDRPDAPALPSRRC